jgi:hypothetical protein
LSNGFRNKAPNATIILEITNKPKRNPVWWQLDGTFQQYRTKEPPMRTARQGEGRPATCSRPSQHMTNLLGGVHGALTR